jgi:hypothetical protein
MLKQLIYGLPGFLASAAHNDWCCKGLTVKDIAWLILEMKWLRSTGDTYVVVTETVSQQNENFSKERKYFLETK